MKPVVLAFLIIWAVIMCCSLGWTEIHVYVQAQLPVDRSCAEGLLHAKTWLEHVIKAITHQCTIERIKPEQPCCSSK
uniref:Chemokine interleukin-8-like domain-containing protein n=1 Tax=Fundulus heteroclitus TaxID=8078 RepID=A0A3Q2TM67_FUNHE